MYVLEIVVCPFVLFLLAIMLFVLLRYMVSDYLPLESSNSSWYKIVNDFSSLFMPFVVHKIPWFDWTNKNHENWYSTKKKMNLVHRKFHEFLMHNSWGLVHITKPWIDISNLWPEKYVCFVQFCDFCLMPTQQFFLAISWLEQVHFSMRWWWGELCTRLTGLVWYL